MQTLADPTSDASPAHGTVLRLCAPGSASRRRSGSQGGLKAASALALDAGGAGAEAEEGAGRAAAPRRPRASFLAARPCAIATLSASTLARSRCSKSQ